MPEADTVLHKITKSLEITKFFCERVQGVPHEQSEDTLFPAPFKKPFPVTFIDNLSGDCPLELSLREEF